MFSLTVSNLGPIDPYRVSYFIAHIAGVLTRQSSTCDISASGLEHQIQVLMVESLECVFELQS